MVRKVIWPASAQKQLEKAFGYIVQQPDQNAEKMMKDILESLEDWLFNRKYIRQVNFERIMMQRFRLLNCIVTASPTE